MAAPGDIGAYGYGIAAGVGANREDLLDLISNISPFDTPFVTSAPKVRANGVLHQWLIDTLAATASAGSLEGDDWTFNTATTRPSRIVNYTMIFRKDIMVSETERAINAAGFKDAYQYELMKATREIARNIEAYQFLVTGNGTAGIVTNTGATNTVRQSLNLGNFLTATANVGTYPTMTASYTELFASASSSAAVLTTVMFNNALEQAFDNGGNPEQAFVSPKIKRQISQFTATNQNRNIAAIEKKLVNAVDLYFSDFGLVEIVLDRWVPEATNTVTTTAASDCRGNIYFLERAKNRLAWLRPMQHTLIGKRGDSVGGIILGEVALECLAPTANVRLAGVNNITA